MMKKPLLQAVAMGALVATISACSANGGAKDKGADAELAVATAVDPVAQATGNAKNTGVIRTVEDAYTAMREIRAARLAIFDGSGPAAISFVNDAAKKLEAAKTAGEKAKPQVEGAGVEAGLIPFDTSMAIAEDYTATPQKALKVKEANSHLAKGDRKTAIEKLRLADINVLTTVALLPVGPTMDHLTDAANLLEQDKYYDANIALKAIEDSVMVQTYDANGVPAKTPAESATTPAGKAATKKG
ncbi:MAG: YfdX family protein [Parasphingorhabdus sp.]|nr:YfdX family protein [Parasphingorhabdus sp.]